MTKEAREFLIKKIGKDFNPIVDEAYAVVPEGARHIAIGRVMLYSKKRNLIFIVWRKEGGHLTKKLLRESTKGKELHIAQVALENDAVVVFIDAGEGYAKMHTMEKIIIPRSDLKGLIHTQKHRK